MAKSKTGKKSKKATARVRDLNARKNPKGGAESNVVKSENDSALSAVRNLK